MTDTKPDLSREAVAQMVRDLRNCASKFPCDAADMIEALLDRAEASERERDRLRGRMSNPADHRYWEGRWRDEAADNERLQAQLTEARASVAASWEAAAVIIAGVERQDLPDATGVLPPDRFDEGTSAAYEALLDATDPSATEALRRVKEKCWHEGNDSLWRRPNPYAAKEAAK